jgi:hypothetical protein
VIMEGELSTDEQAVTMLRGKFIDAFQKYAPTAWSEFCDLQDLYSAFATHEDSHGRWITWNGYAFILEPPEVRPHWSSYSFVRDNPIEMKRYQDQFDLFQSLNVLKVKYEIRDIWFLDCILTWLDHEEQYPNSRDKPSNITTVKMFLIPIHPNCPEIHAYEPQWVSRKLYLAQVKALLERYCDIIEEEALSEEMKKLPRLHARSLEWLVRYHFGRETYAQIAGRKEDSTVGKAINAVAKRLGFTLSRRTGRPMKNS